MEIPIVQASNSIFQVAGCKLQGPDPTEMSFRRRRNLFENSNDSTTKFQDKLIAALQAALGLAFFPGASSRTDLLQAFSLHTFNEVFWR